MSATPRVEARFIKAGHEITLGGRRVKVGSTVPSRHRTGHVEIHGSYQKAGKIRRTSTSGTVAETHKITVHNWTGDLPKK